MISSVVEKITPEKAREYLKANTRNPRGHILNRNVVRRYADDMKNGRWELNGESIVFDRNGVLKNGAHRLAAIILANVPVEIYVTRGVDENTTAYDITYVRTIAQLAESDDISVSKDMLSAVKLMFTLMPDKVGTHMEVKQYARANEDELNRAWRSLLNGEYTRYSKKTACCLASYLMLKSNKMRFYECEVFFKIFSSRNTIGTDGYEPSPAMVVRRMFDERWAKKSGTRAQKEQLDALIQAMNDFHAGKKREQAYKISEPFSFEPLMKQIGGK